MNRCAIKYIIGRVYGIFSGLLCLPLLVSFIYQEDRLVKLAWLTAIAISFFLYIMLGRKKIINVEFYIREGMVICALLWISLSLIGGLPLYLSGQYPSLVDGFFEIASGLTTTGSSVCDNVELLSHSLLFWRSFTHLIGGMGILVFALSLVPSSKSSLKHMAQAEMPGPTFDKLVAKLSDTARILYKIYLAMTGFLVVLLLLGGMPLFDSLCHAFGTAGTGGFGIKVNSIGYYKSSYIHNVLSIGMLAFSLNFQIYYLILIRQVRAAAKNEELHWFLAIVFAAVVLISINVAPLYNNIFTMLRDVLFTVSSVVSTTGYCTVDFGTWPIFSHAVLLGLMFIGGCAGSTAGGLKVSRVGSSVKSAFCELDRQRSPNMVKVVNFNGQKINERGLRSLFSYVIAYALIFTFILLVISIDAGDFQTAFSSVACTFNNIGPGLGKVGPTGGFSWYSPLSKILLSLGMITGRLEIWPVLILFSPKTWSKH